MRRFESRWKVLCAAVWLGACRTTPAPPPASPVVVAEVQAGRTLPEPEHLPNEVREALAQRMVRHGDEMMVMVAAVLLLDYDAAGQLAAQMAAEPKLGRPAPGDKDSLNAQLPEGFFVLQDRLSERAMAVATAAGSRDDVALAQAFGSLNATCVACHATYFRGPEALDFRNFP